MIKYFALRKIKKIYKQTLDSDVGIVNKDDLKFVKAFASKYKKELVAEQELNNFILKRAN